MIRRGLSSNGITVLVVFAVAFLLVQHFSCPSKTDNKVRALHDQRETFRPNSLRHEATQIHGESNPIPPDSVLEKLPAKNISDIFHWFVFSAQETCSKIVRMGKVTDGGWDICDDPRYRIDPRNCLVYSFGIAYDFNFDDAMEAYGCEVYSYDPSMEKAENHTRGRHIYFRKLGIGGKDFVDQHHWPIRTLATLRRDNKQEPRSRRVDMVKMDVEQSEVPAVAEALRDGSLEDVRQLGMETHMNTAGDADWKLILQYVKVFRALWDKGWRIYHSNRNTLGNNVYQSSLDGAQKTRCHEVYFVNTRHRNPVVPL